MLFDDRLATVLRNPAQGEAAARTQYRQLVDLLGTLPPGASGALVGAAYVRLGDLAGVLSPSAQAEILRAPGLRLRNLELVAWLASGEPEPAAAALAVARLSENGWAELIPRLSSAARGWLRNRRDLPPAARRALEPADAAAPAAAVTAEAADDSLPDDAEAGVGALVRRIEAFQRTRRESATAPQLPLGDMPAGEHAPRRGAFDFAANAQGTIIWADPAMAPLAVGLRLTQSGPAATATLDPAGAKAMRRRLPLRGARAMVEGPPAIAGAWRIDAAPAFASDTGAFLGYQGRMRRPGQASTGAARASAAARMRQLLHELRTPVNAIQGFAELIQQQMFSPVPNEYRALAAAIAVDAARLLAGFDEVDRLARLESGAAVLPQGHCDLRQCLAILLQRLEGVLRPRGARIELEATGTGFGIGLDGAEAQQLAWRLLATLAGALAPGEVIDLRLESDGELIHLTADLPLALLGDEGPFAATAPAQPRTISAGMFGTGFTLRLARAEAMAAGGSLERHDGSLQLTLPVAAGSTASADNGTI